MTRSILGTVVCGMIFGALAFFVPHFLVGILIFMLILRLFHGCGRSRGYYGHRPGRLFYMADKIRQMSEEEYAEFKNKMGNGGYAHHGYQHYHSHCCGGNYGYQTDNNHTNEAKKEETTK